MSSDGPAIEDVPAAMEGYAPPQERPPLLSYASLMGVYAGSVAATALAARARGRSLPDRVGLGDLLNIGVATHKLSRLIGKDKVTSPLRAPFTRFEGSGGPSELSESARGVGPRRAIGELLLCPYCLGMWTATGFFAGLVFEPRLTRYVASTFTSLAVSDFLQVAYRTAEDRGPK